MPGRKVKTMSFCIQDPSYENSMYLHEALLTACESSINGGGAYAFVSKTGIELFLGDDSFKKFIATGEYYLVVGLDDITNTKALEVLKSLREKYNGHLIVKAYVHNSRGSTFHPKYSWFQDEAGGKLIIGSGNLTQQGLRHNREAYSVIDCDENAISEIVNEWSKWIEHSQPFLFDIDDPVVLSIAEGNTEIIRAVATAKKGTGKKISSNSSALSEIFKAQPKDVRSARRVSRDAEKPSPEQKQTNDYQSDIFDFDEDASYWTIALDNDVLVAEIPRSGNRWKQVNFDKSTFEDFFGATCGDNGAYRVLLRSIDQNGVMGEIEVRPSVSVSSHNYRFELEAASGIPYPDSGQRPLGVFVKVSPRDFLYELVMPGEPEYESLLSALDERQSPSARMRRLVFNCDDIMKKTVELAIWKCVE